MREDGSNSAYLEIPEGESDEAERKVAKALASVLEEVRAEERAGCAAALCAKCRTQGWPLDWDRMVHISDAGMESYCQARLIWARARVRAAPEETEK